MSRTILKTSMDPMPLKDWEGIWNDLLKDSNLLWLGGARDQFDFFGSTLLYALGRKEEEIKNLAQPLVVSEHTSKSVPLPVCYYNVHNTAGIYIRHNFHDFKISVECLKPLYRFELHDVDLWDQMDERLLHPVYFEGFSRDWVYPPYGKSDGTRFSLMLRSRFEVWTFFYLVGKEVREQIDEAVPSK